MHNILQTNSLLVLLIVLYTSTIIVFSNVNCINIKSIKSDTFDDAKTYARCPSSYSTLVSCGGKTADSTTDRFDGTYIDTSIVPTRCYAVNANNGAGVYAYARCCNFKPTDIDCEYFSTSSYSSDADDAIITAHCGSNTYNTMLGCTVHTPWAYLDGSYPGYSSVRPDTRSYYDTHDYPEYNQCTAQNGVHGGGVKANLACCKSPTYKLTCLTRYGSPTYPISTVTCPNGYFMSGCSGWSLYKPSGWWIEKINSLDTCKARSPNTGNAYSIATCCRLETDSPTTDPTPSPTPSPTSSPTPSPTSSPTAIPTENPTRRPTNKPIVYVHDAPTYNPTDVGVLETENINTESNIKYIHVRTEKDNSSIVIGGLVGALVSVLLCLCCIGALIGWYYLKKRKNLNEGIKSNRNKESPNTMSSISQAYPYPMEGVNGTINKISTNYKGYDTLEQKDNILIPSLPKENNENVNLLVDENSSEENDLYNVINENEKHNTRLLSLDEYEDVLPTDDDNI